MAKLKNLATFSCLSFFFFLFTLSLGRDMITPDQYIEDGQTLVSAGEIFESGFFNFSGSTKRYLGIWYKKMQPIPTVVWVANGDSPITDSPAVLNLTADGNLALYGHASHVVWSTNTSNLSDPIVQLLDSGNLVLIDRINNGSTRLVWQSFDWPSDTLLPGMKFGFNKQLNLDWHLTSWKSSSDPSPGSFYFKSDPRGYPGIYVWNGTILKYRSGSWNGYGFSGVPDIRPGELLHYNLFIKQDEIYYTYEMINKSIISRLVLSQSGELNRYVWLDPIHGWTTFMRAPKDQCDEYAECGAYGVCNINDSPVCKCLRGFVPKSPENWALRDGSDGCVRRTALDCGRGDGFVKVPRLKLPDASNATVNKDISLLDCSERCLKDCSCMAFSNFYEEGSACLTWYSNLIDIREFAEGGQDLYVRLASSEQDTIKSDSSKKKHVIVIVISLFLFLGFLLLVFLKLFLSKKKQNQGKSAPFLCT